MGLLWDDLIDFEFVKKSMSKSQTEIQVFFLLLFLKYNKLIFSKFDSRDVGRSGAVPKGVRKLWVAEIILIQFEN